MVDVVAHLFVYGTLMAGERNAARIPAHLVQRRRGARVHGVLVDLGRYPALRVGTDEDGVVVGELLALRPDGADALLLHLDVFEGPGYERRALPVRGDGDDDTTVAWVFVQVSGGAGGTRIPDGDWRAWRRRRSGDQTL